MTVGQKVKVTEVLGPERRVETWIGTYVDTSPNGWIGVRKSPGWVQMMDADQVEAI